MIQRAVGGFIETVPYFDTILIDGAVQPCVAFCDEEGKLKGKLVNAEANRLWSKAVERITGSGTIDDVLVGDVVVFTGDEEFMKAL